MVYKFPLVEDSFGFSLAAIDRVRLDQAHRRAQADGVLDLMGKLVLQVLHGADAVAEHVGGHFDAHLDLVQVSVPRKHDLVVRQSAFHRQDGRFNLRRKHVHAANDEHVVAAMRDAADAADRPPARTGLGRRST